MPIKLSYFIFLFLDYSCEISESENNTFSPKHPLNAYHAKHSRAFSTDVSTDQS